MFRIILEGNSVKGDKISIESQIGSDETKGTLKKTYEEMTEVMRIWEKGPEKKPKTDEEKLREARGKAAESLDMSTEEKERFIRTGRKEKYFRK